MTLADAYTYYLNADSPKLPAEFSYEFSFPDMESITYRYKKIASKTLVAEEMIVGNQRVFSWDAQKGEEDFSNLAKFGFATLNQQYRDRNISFLRYIANNSALDTNSPVKKLWTSWVRCSGLEGRIPAIVLLGSSLNQRISISSSLMRDWCKSLKNF